VGFARDSRYPGAGFGSGGEVESERSGGGHSPISFNRQVNV